MKLPYKPTVLFDSIIFGLQTYGGISNYWRKIIASAQKSGSINPSLILPIKIKSNDFKINDYSRSSIYYETVAPVWLSRYLPVKFFEGDVFHTSYYRIPSKPFKKYVVTVYDFIYERYRHGPARWLHHQQKMNAINCADEIICISEFTRSDILNYCPNLNPNNIHVIPLAVDKNTFFTDLSDKNKNSLGILYVGQRDGYKRFDLVVNSLKQNKEFKLEIVGPPLSAYELDFIKNSLGTNWLYHGSVTDSQLRNIYARAHCFVFPSDYEGFGLPILESMACSCPVVCSKAASLPEVGGNAAYYVDDQTPTSYLKAFEDLKDIEMRNIFIERGLSRVDEFSWENTCTKTFKIYTSI